MRLRSARKMSRRALDRYAVRVEGLSLDAKQGSAPRDVEQTSGSCVRGDRRDPFDGAYRSRVVTAFEEFVDRTVERLAQQSGEALGREARVLQQDRKVVRETQSVDLEDLVAFGELQRLRGRVRRPRRVRCAALSRRRRDRDGGPVRRNRRTS